MPQLSVCFEMVFADESIPDRIEAAAEAGADAVEFWGWREKDLDGIIAACDEHGVDLATMGGASVSLTDPDQADAAVADIRESIETAVDIGCPNLIITVGQEQADLDRETQHENIVSVLERVAPDAEDAGITLVVEPLNTAVDHPGYYLSSSSEGYEIVAEVDSPAVELLFDIYHQQITEGNLIDNLTEHVEQIGYIHIADVPGRHEPGTGEINYPNVLTALADAGYDGYVGCEFRPEGDHAAAVENCRDILDR